jgi:hypothetical protein
MKNSMRRLTKATIGIAALVLMVTAPTQALARGPRALKIQAVAVHGRSMTVMLANVGPRPLHGTVVARVLTRSGLVTVVASVDVGAGSTSTLRTELPDTAAGVPPLGVVVDDGVPF